MFGKKKGAKAPSPEPKASPAAAKAAAPSGAQKQPDEKDKELAEVREQLAKIQQDAAESHEKETKMAAELEQRKQEIATAFEEAKRERADLESKLAESTKQLEALSHDVKGKEGQVMGSTSAQSFLDATIGECEFAKPFAYVITLRLKGGEERSTAPSAPSDRPVFTNASLLLPCDKGITQQTLVVSVAVMIPGPTGAPVKKVLGEAEVQLTDLTISEDGTASRRVTKSVGIVRGAQLTVGRVTIGMQVRVLTPSQAAAETSELAKGESVDELFDRSLWPVVPFQQRIHVLVHTVRNLPQPPQGGSAKSRLVMRLLRFDGHVVHESATTDVTVVPGDSLTDVVFNQEVVIPVSSRDELRQQRLQMSLEMVSTPPPGAGAGPTTTAVVLDVNTFLHALPILRPVHLNVCPSAGRASSHARPLPSLLCTLTHEPVHKQLDGLAGHGVEFRVHGVPATRPLPHEVNEALIAIFPDFAGSSAGSDSLPHIPVTD